MNEGRPPLRVLAAFHDAQSTLAAIRVLDPLRAVLQRGGGTLVAEDFPFVRRSQLGSFDVLIVQRGLSQRHLGLMQAMKRLGGAVIYEIDDLLLEPAPHLLHQRAMAGARPWVQRCLAQADVVTTTAPRLAAALAPWAAQVDLVPNAAFALPGSTLPAARPDQPCTLLLAASDRLAGGALLGVLRELQAQRGASLSLVAVGEAGPSLQQAGLAVRAFPLLPRPDFLALARELPNAVAVIPLDDSPFSACKSAVKWFDFAEAGVPTLASAVPPYSDVIEHGRTGALVPDSPAAWREALTRALDDVAWRQAVAEAARAQVRAQHGASLTEAAWSRALDHALALARQRTHGQRRLPALAWPQRAWHGMQRPLDALLVAFRRLNRQRLLARQQRRAAKNAAAKPAPPR